MTNGLETPRKGQADCVVIDYGRGTIEIDGETVPYYLAESGPTTEDWGDGEQLVTFTCFVLAKSVERIGDAR
ncbi:hypothetical protein [Mycobacteroides abscessus]|uniref:hypothetical protein n=1 Tax=Mycobacteroides abscessus TaxID=36809 RepID=UPI0009A824FF|nr:hypothetical protein [Mycobacteroides abscessus]MDM3950370.1 hypothetical protein [Mycobacteroides abscessus]SLI10496.1 Uncharacterised protein [Mycobacteroides abscessus subsp. massiliense]